MTSKQGSSTTSKVTSLTTTISTEESITTSKVTSPTTTTSTKESTTTTSKITSPTPTTFTLKVSTPTSGPLGPGCVWSNCSCTKTCADLAEHETASCTEETCKPGWSCPPGLVLHNNKLVSPVLECPCYHNQTFYKTGQTFENGTCSSCLCLGDSVRCTQTCNIKSCPPGEELLDDPAKCCFCRKISTVTVSSTTPATMGGVSVSPMKNLTTVITKTTTSSVSTLRKTVTPKATTSTAKQPTPALETSTRFVQTTSQPTATIKPSMSTQAATSSEKPTTEVQIERCNVRTENKSIIDEFGCSNTQPIRQTSCQGSCNSNAVVNITSPWVHVECFCCKPKNLSGASVPMTCPEGGVKVFNYLVITECSCESCESHEYEAKIRTVVSTMFGNTTKVTDEEILH
ncbi:mucin-5B-like [Oculina patagonica]